jgi:ABC-type uncharacterized transport system.
VVDGRAVAALFIGVVVIGTVTGTAFAVAGGGGGGGSPDGADISGQSPEQFQPGNLDQEFDEESGTIDIGGDADGARILVDTRHSNRFSRSDLEPLSEAMFEAGHSLEFADASADSSRRAPRRSDGGAQGADYAATLEGYDGLLIIQPTEGFSQAERQTLRNYTDAGGRVVLLAEPTQVESGSGPFAAPSTVQFGANNLTQQFGVRVGSEILYNIDDRSNDNNFKSIYASPSGAGMLTEGVDTISLDTGGYAVVGDTAAATTVYTAENGTRTLETRRGGDYGVVARSGNLAFVADSSFVEPSELYDVDNEVFAGNLLEFLVTGDVDPEFGANRTTPEPPGSQTPTPPA